LIKSNYTGEETVYTAKNTKTGQVETLDKAAFDLYKKQTPVTQISKPRKHRANKKSFMR
jgi:hypothetical protein